jgi:esterase/lipase
MLFGLFWLLKQDAWWQGFGMQALAWGGVDAVIGLLGLRGLTEKMNSPVDVKRAVRDARRLRLILWVNAGLDVLYISGGMLWALVWGREAWAMGRGWGVVLQGAFLLVFDVVHALTAPGEIEPPDIGYFVGRQHERYEAKGGKPAAVLVHGFPGSPNEMRPLAEALRAAGWTVVAPLLPGFGAEIKTLYQQRVLGWITFLADEVRRLRALGHGPVVLIGYSMGAGLSIPVAVQSKPDGLVLLAPFWWPVSPWVKGLLSLVRLFLPGTLHPLRRADFSQGRVRQALEQFVPELNWDDEGIQTAARRFGLPLVFVEQFWVLGEQVQRNAQALNLPLLVMQAEQDPVVSPANTQRLLAKLRTPVRFVSVMGDHNMTLPEHAAYAVVQSEVVKFCHQLVEN